MSTSAASSVPSSSRPTPSSVPGGRVCDRCRFKKIKCDGHQPCKNCRNVNFPCDRKGHLSKHATPRSYVQYLETRIKQLEKEKGRAHVLASPDDTGSTQPQEPNRQDHRISSSKPNGTSFGSEMPSWPILRELGAHIKDEEGFSRYIGPSGGIDFTSMVLQEVLDDDLPSTADFQSIFIMDDIQRRKRLIESDINLANIDVRTLPDRFEADRVINTFFTFASRMFPILHRPSFDAIVQDLYSANPIDQKLMEGLTQFHLVMSLGHGFEDQHDQQFRLDNQVIYLQRANKCIMLIPHQHHDGLVCIQTLALKAYAYILLRQRTEAIQITGEAMIRVTQCGLHNERKIGNGAFLRVEMRRRVFWCVFALHVFHSALQGLPRLLHEGDITIAEPSDIDDEFLTENEVLPSVRDRTKIHRFVATCRLTRLLSRTLDTLWSHNARQHVSARIAHMNRMCCEHLLDQLDYSFTEIPNDLPDGAVSLEELATDASWAKQQLLYHYIRWLIQRPGISLSLEDPMSAACMEASSDAAGELLIAADCNRRVCAYLDIVPAVHPTMIFMAALSPIFRTTMSRKRANNGYSSPELETHDLAACQSALRVLAAQSLDHTDRVRQDIIRKLMIKTYGETSVQIDMSPREPYHYTRPSTEPNDLDDLEDIDLDPNNVYANQTFDASNTQQQMPFHPYTNLEQEVGQMNSQNEMCNFVHQSFSSDPWMVNGQGNTNSSNLRQPMGNINMFDQSHGSTSNMYFWPGGTTSY